MSTPKIDTMRREISEAVALLEFIAAQLEDVHDIAYSPSRSATEKVNGGSPDWALDAKGNPDARDLLGRTSRGIFGLINDHYGLRHHADELLSFLTAGKGGTRSDRTADAQSDEVIAAIDAQHRRRARGEYEPAPLVDQPIVVSQTDWRHECEALRSAVRKAVAQFVDEHQTCQSTMTDHRGQRTKLKRRPQVKLLTPREREAWTRAYQSVSAITEPKAS